MAIYYYSFKTPLGINDISDFDLQSSLLFAQKHEIPPDFIKDITPPNCVDKFELKTKINPHEKDREDTIATIEVTFNGKKKTNINIGPETDIRTAVETEINKKTCFEINEQQPSFVLSRPEKSYEATRHKIEGVVIYVKS